MDEIKLGSKMGAKQEPFSHTHPSGKPVLYCKKYFLIPTFNTILFVPKLTTKYAEMDKSQLPKGGHGKGTGNPGQNDGCLCLPFSSYRQ